MERIQHAVEPNSQEWLQLRAGYLGASEIGAVLGLSRHTTRTEVMKAKKLGLTKEFSQFVQERVLDRGHEVEELARTFAEGIIGEQIYRTTWSYGRSLASCDGLTAMDDIGWECKQYNAEYFDMVTRGEMPDEHMPQVQQQLYVTGADKWLFMVSDGTEERTVSMWVYQDQEWFKRIQAATEQFFKDLETFEVEPEYIPAAATLVDDLMLPSITVTGSIAVESNLELFGNVLVEFIGRINKEPATDEDFSNIQKAIKSLEKAEDWLDKQEENAISKFDQLNQAIALKNSLKELARENRLMLQKIDKAEKENRKAAIVQAHKDAYDKHAKEWENKISIMFYPAQVNFADAVKGKKTISSMQEACGTMLANAKIACDNVGRDLMSKLDFYNGVVGDYKHLFADLNSIIYKDSEAFELTVNGRISQHKEQERLKAEAAAKAQAEREEQIKRDAIAKAEADKQRALDDAAKVAELEKQTAVAAALAEQKQAEQVQEKPVFAEVLSDEVCTMLPDSQEQIEEQKMINLGEINRRLGFTVSADFLSALGFDFEIQKNAKLYREVYFLRICMAIVNHIKNVMGQHRV